MCAPTRSLSATSWPPPASTSGFSGPGCRPSNGRSLSGQYSQLSGTRQIRMPGRGLWTFPEPGPQDTPSQPWPCGPDKSPIPTPAATLYLAAPRTEARFLLIHLHCLQTLTTVQTRGPGPASAALPPCFSLSMSSGSITHTIGLPPTSYLRDSQSPTVGRAALGPTQQMTSDRLLLTSPSP
uniref:Uncharacterized protein n=1 Tax=Molossus molossus TaxID=27622 RepID=A0A7J8BBG2_MOLMO|nr:hypothetical protein HJG59_010470 [Molossus molossus]